MAEKIKADIYISYLEQILAGKTIETVKDIEIEELLLLSKTMIAEDLSVNSKIRENLRKKLLAQVMEDSNLYMLSSKDDELDEESLEHVAAGYIGQVGEYLCPYCGSRSMEFARKCPFCSH